MFEPLVSICIPVYNGEQAIERCLKSVLDQGVADSEILVVDNCSTDRTVEIAENVLRGLPNARVIKNETNLGRIENWNRCLDIAGGKYLKFLMVNDVLLKDSVKVLLNEALKDEEIVIVSSMHRFSECLTDKLEEMCPPQSVTYLNGLEAAEMVNNGGDPFWAGNGMLIKLEPVRKGGLRFREDLPYLGDKFFFLQLSSFGKTVFLQSVSYLFNTAAKSRVYFVGMKPQTFLPEHLQFVEEIGRMLSANGSNQRHRKYELLLGSYKRLLHEQKESVHFSLTRKLFAGRTWFLFRALLENLFYLTRIRRAFGFVKSAMREKMPFLIPVVGRIKRLSSQRAKLIGE